jgi:DNA polymerase elongation subunit (family B)
MSDLRSYRLIDARFYNADDENPNTNAELTEAEKRRMYKDGKKPHPRFSAQLFGKNERGESMSVTVQKFKPFFFVKVPDAWTSTEAGHLREALIARMKKSQISRAMPPITQAKFVERETLYGFDNHKQHRFLYYEFANMTFWQAAKGAWYDRGVDESLLREGGFMEATLYEVVPPELRFFHVREISPSGWVKLSAGTHRVRGLSKRTHCNHEYHAEQLSFLIPQPEKETQIPYTIMSFDIEASSSHGDFPLPVKTYRKLAANMVDIVRAKAGRSLEEVQALIRRIVRVAMFPSEKTKETDNVESVFLKRPYDGTTDELDAVIHQFMGCSEASKVSHQRMVSEEIMRLYHDYVNEPAVDATNDEEAAAAEEAVGGGGGGNWWSKGGGAKRTRCGERNVPAHVVMNAGVDRVECIQQLTALLGTCFRPLRGDMVTQIGSTFTHFGTHEPYFKHVAVLDTVDAATEENTQYESLATEAEVLLAWRDVVIREDPDVIIGYNICSFDYEFMYQRAKECHCDEEFVQLSRNKGESCLKLRDFADPNSGDIERLSTTVATGTYELSYIKMPGRIQVDMLTWFRKNENYSCYTLDFVSGYNIGDKITAITPCPETNETQFASKNLYGLSAGNYVHIEEINHSTSNYKGGAKFQVTRIAPGSIWIAGIEAPSAPTVRWGLAKDDIGPKDIFRLNLMGPTERATVSKYCLRDCELVQSLFLKVDVLTTVIELSRLCCVPMSYILFRGQGIKLTSYVARQCRAQGVCMPAIAKGRPEDGYEGAIVLDPKKQFLFKAPAIIGDFASLYPSCMISDNLCPSSKVSVKTYDLEGTQLDQTGDPQYDNLPDYIYIDVPFNTYSLVRAKPGAKVVKHHTGHRVCRFAQHVSGKNAIMPAILKELLKARKDTRKLAKTIADPFMKNVLDKRQLAIKMTANSLYGQLGAKTGSFYEPDIAASTTATGRMLLLYAKQVVEECYTGISFDSPYTGRSVFVDKSEYIYGDTDSVFFVFELRATDGGAALTERETLDISIEIGLEACALVSDFLKPPHDFEYEKAFLPFCLLSKKRYVGIKFTDVGDPKGVRTEMGIVLKRRDNAPVVKDVYGGIIDILMHQKDVVAATTFLHGFLTELLRKNPSVPLEKLIITKSLRSNYKNPQSQAHKVLADRMGVRDPGNKPSAGDRIPYVHIITRKKNALQGEKIENPEYVVQENLLIDYAFYVTNQIMKPVVQVLATVLLDYWRAKGQFAQIRQYEATVARLKKACKTPETLDKKVTELRSAEVQKLFFNPLLRKFTNHVCGQTEMTSFCIRP